MKTSSLAGDCGGWKASRDRSRRWKARVPKDNERRGTDCDKPALRPSFWTPLSKNNTEKKGNRTLKQMKSARRFPSPHAWSYMPLSLSTLIYCDAFKTPRERERVSAAPGEMPRSHRSAVAIGFLTFNWVNLLYCEYKFNCHHSCFIWRAYFPPLSLSTGCVTT